MLQALFKANIKGVRTIWLTMLFVFILYHGVILSMYDPTSALAMEQILELFPETLLKVFGMERVGTTLLSFVTIYMYGIQLLFYPMAVSIITNHRLIAAHIERGSMAYLLATPNSREKIVSGQVLFSLVSIALFFTAVAILGIGLAEIMLPGELDIGGFILVNVYSVLMYFAIGGIGFLASCMASDGKLSLGLGIGVPALFMLFQMIGDAGEKFSWVGNLSLYNLFKPEELIRGETSAYVGMVSFAAIAVVCYGSAVHIFSKRDFHV